MKKPLPREGLIRRGPGEQIIRRGPGEQDIPDFGPDVEGHGIGDTINRPIDQGVPGAPGSDGILGLPRTGGEFSESEDK
jgi:hypothetical protein